MYINMEMNRKIFYIKRCEEVILFFLFIGIPLTSLPEKFSLPGISGNFSTACLFLITFFLILECFVYHSWANVFKDVIYKKYWTVLFVWNTICLIIGTVELYGIPLQNILGISPTKIFQLIATYFCHPILSEMSSWISIIMNLEWKFFRDYFLRLFIIIFLIQHLYHNDWNLIFHRIESAVLVLSCLLGFYSIPEIIWLWTQNPTTEVLLSVTNHFFYDPVSVAGWYPPLLWEHQLRSLCTEPGALGIIAGFLLPFLWYRALSRRNCFSYFLVTYLSFMILMTNSRAAWIIFLIEVIGSLSIIFIARYSAWKKYGIIIISSVFLSTSLYVGGNYYFQQIGQGRVQSIDQLLKDKVAQNVTSVATTNKRSNSARYGITLANLYIGMEHPLFGVGQGYESLYMKDKFPAFARDNEEINNWTNELHEKGILRGGYPNLNQISAVFSWSGVIGVILFLFLPVYSGIYYLKDGKILNSPEGTTIFITMIGQLLGLMSGQFTYTYAFSLALFILYMLYWQRKKYR